MKAEVYVCDCCDEDIGGEAVYVPFITIVAPPRRQREVPLSPVTEAEGLGLRPALSELHFCDARCLARYMENIDSHFEESSRREELRRQQVRALLGQALADEGLAAD